MRAGTEAAVRWRLRRGMRELDLMLERFFRQRWPELSESKRANFVTLLEHEDDTLWDWLSARTRPVDPDMAELVNDIIGCAGD